MQSSMRPAMFSSNLLVSPKFVFAILLRSSTSWRAAERQLVTGRLLS